jgi:hypothetical protein
MFERGDKIKWQYNHFLNSKQHTLRVKQGVFIRVIKTKNKFLSDWTSTKKAIVKFDGNKGFSKVNITELQCNYAQHRK